MKLSLEGLELRPAQVFGAIRVVPIVRSEPLVDLRMAVRDYDADFAITDLGKAVYTAYVPHGLVMRWSDTGEVEVPEETRIGRREIRKSGPVIVLKGTVRREARRQLRLLPLHLAMEGFLSQQFGGPEIAYKYYSAQFRRFGMSPRVEEVLPGSRMPGLSEALALFELHAGQCGVLLFVGDQLASASIVSHPDDWFAVYRSLIGDFFGTIVRRYGLAYADVPEFGVTLEGRSLDAIAASLQEERSDWARFSGEMASGLFGRDVAVEVLRKVGRYRLVRFVTGTDVFAVPRDGEHLGEALVDSEGRIAYLKSYRLDRGQVRRGSMLAELARHDWDVQALADTEGHGLAQRIRVDLENCGLGWILADGQFVNTQ